LRKKNGYDKQTILIVETPIPKAQRSGIGKLNNTRAAEGIIHRSLLKEIVSKACFGVHTRDQIL
jgi:hypothetical protein